MVARGLRRCSPGGAVRREPRERSRTSHRPNRHGAAGTLPRARGSRRSKRDGDAHRYADAGVQRWLLDRRRARPAATRLGRSGRRHSRGNGVRGAAGSRALVTDRRRATGDGRRLTAARRKLKAENAQDASSDVEVSRGLFVSIPVARPPSPRPPSPLAQ